MTRTVIGDAMGNAELAAEFELAHAAVLCAEAPGVRALEQEYGGKPASDSNAAGDLAGLEGTEVERASWVSLLSRLWLAAAEESVMGLAVLFNSPIRNHAPRSLLRAALEHSGRAHWVVTAPDASARAARAWLARYVGTCEELRISKKDEGATGAMAGAAEREKKMRARIVELFDEPPTTDDRRYRLWTLRDEEYGSFTRIVEELLSRATRDAAVQAMYPTLSLLVHPTTSGVLAFGSRTGDGKLQIPQFEPTFLIGATLTGLIAYRQAFVDVLAHHGWESPQLDPWSNVLDQTIKKQNAK